MHMGIRRRQSRSIVVGPWELELERLQRQLQELVRRQRKPLPRGRRRQTAIILNRVPHVYVRKNVSKEQNNCCG